MLSSNLSFFSLIKNKNGSEKRYNTASKTHSRLVNRKEDCLPSQECPNNVVLCPNNVVLLLRMARTHRGGGTKSLD